MLEMKVQGQHHVVKPPSSQNPLDLAYPNQISSPVYSQEANTSMVYNDRLGIPGYSDHFGPS